MIRRITIVRARAGQGTGLNEDIKWLCSSLGLFNVRDKESSLYRVFVEILKESRQGRGLTSDELAARTGLARGTVVYHLRKLLEAGIIITEKNRYFLRVQNTEMLIDELTRDMERAFEEMQEIARRIDDGLGI